MSTLTESTSIASPVRDKRASIRARARFWDRAATAVLWTVATAFVALLGWIIIYVLSQGLRVISWDFLTKANVVGDYAGPELFNTFYIIGLALMICMPISIGAAVYLVEYARQGPFTTLIRFATETLAGVPSIVLGLFGFLIFVTRFGNPGGFGFSRLAGALTLVILNLPLLVRVSEDALRSVPSELREGSFALGASKFQTIMRVMLPTSLSSLTTGIILTAGKMIGETAALIYTAGGSSAITHYYSLDPLQAGSTLTVRLYELKAEGIAHNANLQANGTAALLILLLLVFNLGLRGLAALLQRRLSGHR